MEPSGSSSTKLLIDSGTSSSLSPGCSSKMVPMPGSSGAGAPPILAKEKSVARKKVPYRKRKKRDWHLECKIGSTEAILKQFQVYKNKKDQFKCKKYYSKEKCLFLLRWNAESQELFSAGKHNHGKFTLIKRRKARDWQLECKIGSKEAIFKQFPVVKYGKKTNDQFICKNYYSKSKDKCRFLLRWNAESQELFSSGQHNHGQFTLMRRARDDGQFGGNMELAGAEAILKQSNDHGESSSSKKEVKEEEKGQAMVREWQHRGNMVDAEQVCFRFIVYETGEADNIHTFECKQCSGKKCDFAVRWNRRNQEIHSAGTKCPGPFKQRPVADLKENVQEKSKLTENVQGHQPSRKNVEALKAAPGKVPSFAKTSGEATSKQLKTVPPPSQQSSSQSGKVPSGANKEDIYVDPLRREWHLLATLDSVDGPHIEQFCEENFSLLERPGEKDGRKRVPFRCKNRKDKCPFRCTMSREDGKIYNRLGHNHPIGPVPAGEKDKGKKKGKQNGQHKHQMPVPTESQAKKSHRQKIGGTEVQQHKQSAEQREALPDHREVGHNHALALSNDEEGKNGGTGTAGNGGGGEGRAMEEVPMEEMPTGEKPLEEVPEAAENVNAKFSLATLEGELREMAGQLSVQFRREAEDCFVLSNPGNGRVLVLADDGHRLVLAKYVGEEASEWAELAKHWGREWAKQQVRTHCTGHLFT